MIYLIFQSNCSFVFDVFQANVQGSTCNRCKDGFYNLDRNNPVGCTECYCFGLSFSCQSSGLGLYEVSYITIQCNFLEVTALIKRMYVLQEKGITLILFFISKKSA